MKSKKLFYFDVETTGLDCNKHDIIQLAYLIEIDGEIREEGNLKCQPFSYNTIDSKALEINRSSVDNLRKLPTPQVIYNQLIKRLDKYVDKYNKEDKFSPAGFNVRFDVDFLKQFFCKNNNKYYGAYFDYHLLSVDVLLHLFDYKGLIKLENYKLVTMAKHFGINFNAHDALSDIKVTRKVLYKLFDYIKVEK